MKKTLAFLTLFLGFVAMFAQSGPTFPYQAVVRNSQNQLIKDSTFAVDVAIYQGATLKYSETQSVTTNANGQLTMNIGGGTAGSGTLNDVADWSVAKFQITYHLSEGDIVSENAVNPVPYALQAANATSAASGNFLTSDSAVITTMQTNIATNADDIAALANRVNTFNTNVCDSVKDCYFSGNASIQNMLQELSDLISAQNHKIDSLAHLVDSLSNLTPGGEPTATFTCGTSTVTDYDGNTYNTVQIGQQCWMKQNLKTTHYSDGTSISLGSSTSTTTAYRYNPDDNSSNVATYGYLYNWKAVMRNTSSSSSNPSGVQGICPTGWHVPSDAEWTQLKNYVSSQSQYVCGSNNTYIAKALASTTGWITSSTTCAVGNTPSNNNATGFSAVPAGIYDGYDGSYDNFGNDAYFWSATQGSSYSAYGRYLGYNLANVRSNSGYDKNNGYSVRCLRDASIGGGDNPSAPAMMSCEQVMECMGDTLGQLNAKIENLQNTVAKQDSTINALNNQVNPPFTCGTSTVTDHEGNVYNTVKIGDQCWTKENMRCTTSPSTGTNILEFPASSYTYSGKKAYYPNDNASNVATYGLLYNWCAAVDTFNTAYGETSTNTSYDNAVSVTFSGNRRGICPQGWHVPSDAEWTQLENYVGSQSEYVCGSDNTNIAKALASTTGWNISSTTCEVGNTQSNNNATGFSAVPAGNYSGSYGNFGYGAYFWSATQLSSNYAYYRYLLYFNAYVYRYGLYKSYGLSVRCVRD